MINEIKNTTIYNKELIVKYNQFYSRSFVKKNFIVIGIITIGFAIYMVAEESYGYALLLFGILLAYSLLTILLQRFTVKRMLKRSPLVENPVKQNYIFFKDYFNVVNPKQSYKVTYDQVDKVRETKTFFLLRTTDKKSLIIDKEGFESEKDLKDLRAYFVVRLNMKDRY